MFCFARQQEPIMQTPEFKVIVIGGSMTGKSTFVYNLFYNKERLGIPRATLGVDVVPVDLHGDEGKIRCNLWDCAGNPAFSGLRQCYWKGATHAIIFGQKGNYHHKWYYDHLPKNVKKIEILDYDQELEDFQDRKDWLYQYIIN